MLKIYTSFVSPITFKMFLDKNILPIFMIRSIWNSSLIGKYEGTCIHFKDLAPSTDLYRSIRDRKISEGEFMGKFAEELMERIEPKKILERIEYLASLCETQEAVLLGFGTKDPLRQREIVAKILGDDIEEWDYGW